MRYSPLVVCKSHYSFMKGIHSISELVEFAIEQNLKNLCLADENGLYGAVEFSIHCQKVGIRPLIGVELTDGHHVVIVIARNKEGYKCLSRIITDVQVNGVRLVDVLKPDNKTLFILCNDPFLLSRWKKYVNIESIYLAPIVSDRKALQSLLTFVSHSPDILRRFPAIPILLLNIFSEHEVNLYKVMQAIVQNRTVSSLQSEEIIVFKDLSVPFLPFKHIVSAQEVAKRCPFQFDFSKYYFPRFVLSET